MDQRMSFVTLAVSDLEATRRFYVDGLGWEPMIHVPGDVLMIKVADKVLLKLRGSADADYIDLAQPKTTSQLVAREHHHSYALGLGNAAAIFADSVRVSFFALFLKYFCAAASIPNTPCPISATFR